MFPKSKLPLISKYTVLNQRKFFSVLDKHCNQFSIFDVDKVGFEYGNHVTNFWLREQACQLLTRSLIK